MRLLIQGEDYPGEVPVAPQGGGLFEVMEDGTLQLAVQMPNPNPAEAAALAEGFSSYSLYTSSEPPHAAIWVWKFAAPVGYLETPFHAGIYRDDRMERYLALPITDNALTVVVLDGQKIANLRMVGLMHEAVLSFHHAAASQLRVASGISRERYAAELEKVYRLTSREIYERGISWRHR